MSWLRSKSGAGGSGGGDDDDGGDASSPQLLEPARPDSAAERPSRWGLLGKRRDDKQSSSTTFQPISFEMSSFQAPAWMPAARGSTSQDAATTAAATSAAAAAAGPAAVDASPLPPYGSRGGDGVHGSDGYGDGDPFEALDEAPLRDAQDGGGYGIDDYEQKRSWNHPENQICCWVISIFMFALVVNASVAVVNHARGSSRMKRVMLRRSPRPPSAPPPPLPPRPYFLADSPPPPSPDAPPPLPDVPPLRARLLLRTGPPPPPPPPPPTHTGWSGPIGRNRTSTTDRSHPGMCPCGSWIESWTVWSAAGVQVTPEDLSPITGLTATCSGADSIGKPLQLLPGEGALTSLPVPAGGGSSVAVQLGRYIDTFEGVGGTGLTNDSWVCPPGEVITGARLYWEPSPLQPANRLVTGLDVYCENPNTCASRDI